MQRIKLFELRSIVRHVLIAESRVSDAQAKFPKLDIEALNKKDPSGKGKYLMWMAKQVSQGAKIEDLAATVKHFHDNMQRYPKKDINAYKNLKELESIAKDVSSKATSAEQRKATKEGAEELAQDNNYKLFYIGTKESCQLYGAGTKWCITMRDASYFEEYTGGNAVFYFAIKKNPSKDRNDKIAFAVMRDSKNNVKRIEYYNANDAKISNDKISSFVTKKLIQVAQSDAAKRPKGLLAKLQDNELSDAEEIDVIKLYEADENIMSDYVASHVKSSLALKMLAASKIESVRSEIATRSDLSPELLLLLSTDSSADVRKRVVRNENLPITALERLAGDADVEVREMVASIENSESLSKATWIRLANDEDQSVRLEIAQNYKAPLEALAVLLNDDDEDVILYLARNANASPEMLDKIADINPDHIYLENENLLPKTIAKVFSKVITAASENSYAIEQIAWHKNTPKEILDRLVRNDYDNDLSRDDVEDIREAVASNANLPVESLYMLANMKSKRRSSIDLALASNTALPEDLLSKFASSNVIWIVREVAENESTPPEILYRIANESRFKGGDEQYVLASLASNNAAPVNLLKSIMKRKTTPDVRKRLANNSKTTSDMLAKLANDKSKYVRLECAKNPKTPVKALLKLANSNPDWDFPSTIKDAKETLERISKKSSE